MLITSATDGKQHLLYYEYCKAFYAVALFVVLKYQEQFCINIFPNSKVMDFLDSILNQYKTKLFW